MQKDVIYIDVEDDITAIIDKVKKSKEKVVALVPPKRIGVLQSAVNLRLLNRAAGNANKHLVLITSNAALGGLAASAKIPVAKNLQSKPELAEIPAVNDDDDDVINGEDLPAHEHAAIDAPKPIPASKINGIDIDGDSAPKAAPTRGKAAKKGIKVPDFGTFRKKAFIFGGLGVLLIAFLVWAIVFAPRATVIVSAETSDQDLSVAVTVGPDVQTSFAEEQLKAIRHEDKVVQTIEFDATGTKDVGERAKGTVRFTTDSYSALLRGVNIPQGTSLTTSSGKVFTTDRSVALSITSGNSDSTSITAAESGESYNGASGSVQGAPSGVNASLTDATAGGTTKQIKVVTQADINKATVEMTQQNTDEAKKKLTAKFEPGTLLIDSSFKENSADPQSSPALGQEATGKAKLTQETTYTIMGVAKAQLSTYLDEALEDRLNKDEQKVYDNGVSTIKFADFVQNTGDQAGKVNVTAVAQIGPKIDDNEIKEQVKGKRTGEIMGDLKAIDGVSDVEVKLSPFWVSGVPDDSNKITVEFKLKQND